MSQEYRTRTQTDVSIRTPYGYDERHRYDNRSLDPAVIDKIVIGNYTEFEINTGSNVPVPTHGQTEYVTVLRSGSGTVTGSNNSNVMNIFGLEGGVTVNDGSSADVIAIANVQNGVRINHGGGGDTVRVANAGSLNIADTPKKHEPGLFEGWGEAISGLVFGKNEITPVNHYLIEHVETLNIEGSDENDVYELNYNLGFNHDRLSGTIDGKGGANVVRINAPASYFQRQYDPRTRTLILTGPNGEHLELKNITAIQFIAPNGAYESQVLNHNPKLLQEIRNRGMENVWNPPEIPTPQQRYAVVDVDSGDMSLTNDPQSFLTQGRRLQVVDTFVGTTGAPGPGR